ncbi:hypothetical protein U5B43_00610 [Campylobacter sp. 9BO]|uniref:hypothetical protein n=1 Tax=Campylobacter sp. 9BO TaxID=3424759 RepID=UPI003D3438AF
MRYEIDLNAMREFTQISEFLRASFSPICDDAELNLDAIYDTLSSDKNGGKIVLKNTHVLTSFGKMGEALEDMLKTLDSECEQWSLDIEPNFLGTLKRVQINIQNGAINELFLQINECLIAISNENDNLKINQGKISTKNILNLALCDEFLGKQICSKNDISELFGKNGIEIKFADISKTIFISATKQIPQMLDECLFIGIANLHKEINKNG